MPSVGTTRPIKKPQIKDGERVALLDAPETFLGLVGDEQRGTVVDLESEPGVGYDAVMAFVESKAALERTAPVAFAALERGGKLWFCYPKITSGVRSDLNRDAGWQVVDDAGWRGVRQIPVDDVWSALRFRPRAEVGT